PGVKGMKRTTGILAILAAVATAVLVAGCNIIVPVSYVIEGPGTIDPEYVLRDTTTAVFVDDRDSVFPRTALRAIVADTIAEQLVAEKAISASNMINARDTLALARSLESASSRVSIERIGREAGAEQVVYVELVGFALTLDGFTPRPTSVCEVKVLDLTAGSRVYPGGGAVKGREVVAQLREVDPANFESFARRRKVEDQLATETGVDVAKLFHQHERVELGENLGVR
ncbi:MAG: hypothetical protein MK085_12490, partial [Phycisphaerales bacterium]|nr:hypothetical protein [Phycisphaerales bacterium]